MEPRPLSVLKLFLWCSLLFAVSSISAYAFPKSSLPQQLQVELPSDSLLITPESIKDSLALGTSNCQEFTITNYSSEAREIASLSYSKQDSNFFSLEGLETPTTIQPGASLTFKACYQTVERGVRTFTLNITTVYGMRTLTHKIPVSVKGRIKCVTIDKAVLFRKPVIVGDNKRERVVLRNCGDFRHIFTADFVENDFHLVSPIKSDTLYPNDSVFFEVEYHPTHCGKISGFFTLRSPNYSDQFQISMESEGAGAAFAIALPDSIKAPHGKTVYFPATITNHTVVACKPGALKVEGPFAALDQPKTVMQPGETQTIIMSYTSTGAATDNGMITFPNSDPAACDESITHLIGNTTALPEDLYENGYVLKQNYPNPTFGTTSFSFAVPIDGAIKIELCNIFGERIRTLYAADLHTGSYLINATLPALAPGVYYYTLTGRNTHIARPLVYLHK